MKLRVQVLEMSLIQEFLDISKDQLEHGLGLHRKSIVIDQTKEECVTVWSDTQVNKMNEMLDAGKPFSKLSEEIEKIRLAELLTPDSSTRRKYAEVIKKSGVTCSSLTSTGYTMEETIKKIAHAHLKFDKMRDILVQATCAEDIRKAKKEDKHAVILDFQNTLMITEPPFDVDLQLNRFDLFYGLGVRVIQLTYNLRNFMGDGCTEYQDGGLSHFGVKAIEKMNELGILVDTSHCGMKTTIDAAEVSKDPIAATHTGCRSVYFHERCKTDEALKAIAEKGGVIGIFAVPMFLGRVVEQQGRKKAGTLKDMLDHIDYAVKLVGVDHVGIGTDTGDIPGRPERFMEEMNKYYRARLFWEGWRPGPPPEGHDIDLHVHPPTQDKLEAWNNWSNYTVGLVSRGYSDQEIQKIIGENWLRLYEKVIG
jgi:membrane dipeptidase